MSKEQEGKAVLLSTELYGRIEERVKATGFGSVDEYITFVLEEVLKEEGEEEERAFSKEEEEEVKKRLRALGYLE
jgi:Arc/MetJ-type ribon-helix-helix transcriptional regulator